MCSVLRILSVACVLALGEAGAVAADVAHFRHGYADNGGVKIHYVTRGRGPLVVLLHTRSRRSICAATTSATSRRAPGSTASSSSLVTWRR